MSKELISLYQALRGNRTSFHMFYKHYKYHLKNHFSNILIKISKISIDGETVFEDIYHNTLISIFVEFKESKNYNRKWESISNFENYIQNQFSSELRKYQNYQLNIKTDVVKLSELIDVNTEIDKWLEEELEGIEYESYIKRGKPNMLNAIEIEELTNISSLNEIYLNLITPLPNKTEKIEIEIGNIKRGNPSKI